MKIEETALPGVLLIEPQVFGDRRGTFLETWRQERYRQAGIPDLAAQDNLSLSRRGVLRGLHLQNPYAQAKLCQAVHGELFDVAVDARPDSPHFGKWVGVPLSGETRQQLFIPAGFAHGFCVLSETALFLYKCSERYDAESEISIRWDDPDLGIEWPVSAPILSENDAAAPRLREIDPARLVLAG